MTTYDLGRVVGDTGPVGPTGPTGPGGPTCSRLWIVIGRALGSSIPQSQATFTVPPLTLEMGGLDLDQLRQFDFVWFSYYEVLCYVSAIASDAITLYVFYSGGLAVGVIPAYKYQAGPELVDTANLAPGVTGNISFFCQGVIEPNTVVFNVDTGRIMKVNARSKPNVADSKTHSNISATGLYDLSTFVTQQYVDDTIQALDLSQVSF